MNVILNFLNWLFSSTMEINIGGHFPVSGPPFFVILFIILFIWSLVWTAKDARRRGKNVFWAVIFALAATWPVSLLWWLWLRPPLQKPAQGDGASPRLVAN